MFTGEHFLGTWEITEVINGEGVADLCRIPADKKASLIDHMKHETFTVTKEGDHLHIKVTSKGKTIDVNQKAGGIEDSSAFFYGAATQVIKLHPKELTDTKLVHIMMTDKGEFIAELTREVKGNEMIGTITGHGITGIKKYVKK